MIGRDIEIVDVHGREDLDYHVFCHPITEKEKKNPKKKKKQCEIHAALERKIFHMLRVQPKVIRCWTV